MTEKAIKPCKCLFTGRKGKGLNGLICGGRGIIARKRDPNMHGLPSVRGEGEESSESKTFTKGK